MNQDKIVADWDNAITLVLRTMPGALWSFYSELIKVKNEID